MKDLRSFLAQCSDEPDGFLRESSRQWRPDLQVSSFAAHLEKGSRYPVLQFDHVLDLEGGLSPFPVVSNLFARREAIALGLGLDATRGGMELALEYQRRVGAEIEPVVVAAADAPVKEVHARLDLRQFPILTHHLGDRGPYLTMVCVARDPDSGVYNVSFHRAMYVDPTHFTVFMERRHLWDYYNRWMAKGLAMPMAYVAGHHPAFYLGSCALSGIGTDEYRTIGGMLGEALRLVPSETFGADLLVPADAEIVIEGCIRPGAMAEEGPFGDFTGYYSPADQAPLLEVTAITHRRDAHFVDVFVGHRDHALLGAVPKEGGVFERVRQIVPTVTAVSLPDSGGGRLHCYVSIDKQVEGEPRLAAMAAMTASELIKHVIVVDADIDVFNEREVLWAVATRVQAERDVDVIRGVKGSRLDPSAVNPDYASKMMIDATRSLDLHYAERLKCAPWDESQ